MFTIIYYVTIPCTRYRELSIKIKTIIFVLDMNNIDEIWYT